MRLLGIGNLFKWGAALLVAASLAAEGRPSRDPNPAYESEDPVTNANRIDELNFALLESVGQTPNFLCSDGVFFRRAYLDLTGTLPEFQAARDFIENKDPKKRAKLIDRLLETDMYVGYRTMKWLDLLRVKSEFPINLWPAAVQAYARWVRDQVKANVPHDQFMRSLLLATGANFKDPEANFYRAVQRKEPMMLAQTAALTFLGVRAEKWPAEKLQGLAVFFSKVAYKSTLEWKEEIVFFDPDKPPFTNAAGKVVPATLPDGTRVNLPPDVDPRLAFANWLTGAGKKDFARALVNRMWFWTMGRGLVHEPDDIRDDNPCENPELLDFLADELIAAKYDTKRIMRLIMNSSTYQQSALWADKPLPKDVHFGRYRTRRMEAEVIIDAVNRLTWVGNEGYQSAIPEPFTFIPDRNLSIDLADGSISSPFLEMFGRPARDTGTELERNNQPSPEQEIHLLNSSHIQDKITRGQGLRRFAPKGTSPEKAIENTYLGLLCRLPTDDEARAAKEYANAGNRKGKNNENYLDLIWSIMNGSEFILKH